MNGPLKPEDIRALRQRLQRLQAEHRTLEERIRACDSPAYAEQLGLHRLKKRNLSLRDAIEKIHSALIPDLNA